MITTGRPAYSRNSARCWRRPSTET
jgi:hypothetical protein